MIYRKVPSQKIITKQGDCVIHVPNNYGGTALLEQVDEEDYLAVEEINADEEIKADVENDDFDADGEGTSVCYANDENEASYTNGENNGDRQVVQSSKNERADDRSHTGLLSGLLDGFGISFEDLLLIGLILLVVRDGNTENDDLVLILAFLLLRK